MLPPVALAVFALAVYSPALGQAGSARSGAGSAADPQTTSRREILESERWRQAQRTLNEWLSVQQIYTPEEVAAIREAYRLRIDAMTPQELNEFMRDMEERLAVLMSPQARDARQWLSQFLSVSRNPEAALGRPLPDVANMSASEIRQEIEWLQQHRAARQEAQLAFDRSRELQLQSARDAQAARQQARQQTQNRSVQPPNNAAFRSQYAPPRDRRPAPMSVPIYSISPWGTPIHWHPMRGQW
jgi:hypothetical protein